MAIGPDFLSRTTDDELLFYVGMNARALSEYFNENFAPELLPEDEGHEYEKRSDRMEDHCVVGWHHSAVRIFPGW